MNNKWDKEKLQELKTLLTNGNSIKSICSFYNITKARLYQIINKYNLPYRNINRNKLTKDEIRIWELILNARNRDDEFDLSLNDFLPLPTHCPILNIELDYGYKGIRRDNSPSLDRLDNNKPYKKGNVFIVSWRANRIKNNGSAEEHELIAAFMRKQS